MRQPGEILLVSCYELGHQPLGLASPLAFLERAGFRPRAVDTAVAPLDDASIARARLIAIAAPMHTALRLALRVIDRVGQLHPTAHLCCYGLYAPLHAELLRARGVATVLGGECEAELVALAERLERGELADAPPVTLARLDFPTPSRRALPLLDRYARVLRDGKPGLAGYTEASRGCKHLCRHCPIPSVYDGRFFVVPVETVLADVRQQVAAGATHVTLGDADFLNGPKHALAVARAIHAEFPSLTWDATIKVEHLLRHADVVVELAQRGLLFVVSAVETLSDRVLAILDKGHTRADVLAALRLVRSLGVTLRPSLLPFTPWSTLEDYLDLLHFIDAESLHDAIEPVHLSIRLLLPPGSLLLDRADLAPHLLGLDEEGLTWRWRHPDPRMDALQREVAALVEKDAQGEADPRDTFERVRALAHRAAGLGAPTRRHSSTASTANQRAPRLSEAWFC